ncbi:hypothetical protein U3516DRAFT_652694 [Neocallimastix sp. 'constans']
MFNDKSQVNGKFLFNSLDKKRKQPDSNVLNESSVALLSITQQYHNHLKELDDELKAIHKEEAEIHDNFRKRLSQNQKRLAEFKNSESKKRESYASEFMKNIEELNRKYKNQLHDKTVCKKCYNQVVLKSNCCIGCQEPVCKQCQDDRMIWGCRHFHTSKLNTSNASMDIDKNENNKMLVSNRNIHNTQINISNEVCCKECIRSLLPKRCEKCFKRLCDKNKNHRLCTVCSHYNNNNQNDSLLCDACKEDIRQYQNSLHNKDKDKILRYSFINDTFLFNDCGNPSCKESLCKNCMEKEGATCQKCGKVYCSNCQKNNVIKIVMDSKKDNNNTNNNANNNNENENISSLNDSHHRKSYKEFNKYKSNKNNKIKFNSNLNYDTMNICPLPKDKIQNIDYNFNLNKDLKQNDKSNNLSTGEIIFFNEKENIPLRKNNTKKKVREEEAKLNSHSRHKSYSKIMKVRRELKAYQQGLTFTNININKNNHQLNIKDSGNSNNNNNIDDNYEKEKNPFQQSNEMISFEQVKDEKNINNKNIESSNYSEINVEDEFKNLRTDNDNKNITIKPLEKALSNVSLE